MHSSAFSLDDPVCTVLGLVLEPTTGALPPLIPLSAPQTPTPTLQPLTSAVTSNSTIRQLYADEPNDWPFTTVQLTGYLGDIDPRGVVNDVNCSWHGEQVYVRKSNNDLILTANRCYRGRFIPVVSGDRLFGKTNLYGGKGYVFVANEDVTDKVQIMQGLRMLEAKKKSGVKEQRKKGVKGKRSAKKQRKRKSVKGKRRKSVKGKRRKSEKSKRKSVKGKRRKSEKSKKRSVD